MDKKTEKELKKLIELFERNKAQYKSTAYDESNTRTDFIDKFFELLDWDVRNTKGYSEQYREVVREDKVIIRGKAKAPDYSFRIGGVRKFFVEAKKPSINIKEDIGAAFQVRRYAYTAKLPLSILTDFEEFAIYDTRIKPNQKDKASVARIFYSTYDELLNPSKPDPEKTNFEYIASIFSIEEIKKGSLDRFVEETKRKKGTSEVDKEFLKSIEHWREMLAKNIALRNEELDIHELNFSVQKIIDRIIFLRITEDRGIEEYGTLQKLAGMETKYHVYEELVKLFHKADKKYNSGLFDFKKDQLTPTLTIDYKVFIEIIDSLYYPKCPYEFSVLGVEILGNIYEQFLGKVIRLTDGHRAKIEEKPEVKKAGGVYYTPKYIVDYIVENTVGEKLKEITLKSKIKPLTILDPACGSGSFLIGAFDYLMKYYLKFYSEATRLNKSLKNGLIFEAGKNDYRLSIEEKQRILIENIYGVDIDDQAVEVTKLSLLLKLLEDESEQSVANVSLFKHTAMAVLPDLSDNIKCGNSLIGSDFFDNRQMSLFDDEEIRKINPFDWEDEFPDIFARGGFDCVIGNPPYFNVDETWGKGSKRQQYLKEFYDDIYTDKTDILFYFIGKSLQIAKGKINFIISRAFLEAFKAMNLRDTIRRKSSVFEIIDFNNFLVFFRVGITTCLLGLDKSNKTINANIYQLITSEYFPGNLMEQKQDCQLFTSLKCPNRKLTSDSWIFMKTEIQKICKKINKVGQKISEILIIGKGMETGRNSVFCIAEDHVFRGFKLPPKKKFTRARNSDIQRYYFSESSISALYLEEVVNFESMSASLQKYLLSHENELKKRAAYKRGDCLWWKYTWPLHKELIDKNKIYTPYLAKMNRFALDLENRYLGLTDTTVLFENGQHEDMKYILALLNSKLLTFRFKYIGKLKSGGIREYFWNSVSKLPIVRIDYTNSESVQIHETIVELVNQIMKLQKKLHSAKTDRDKELYQKQINILDRKIDKLVYRLYGLTDEEIQIVEGSV
ncbi:N-6 DNA methylase [bacterium]|nr:N-6 DNA methylase [bacterium]